MPGFKTVSKQQAAHAHAIFVTWLMQSLARICQNRAREAKRALLAAGVNTKLYFMYSRGWTIAIKRSSTKTHKFTTDVLLNKHLVKSTQDSHSQSWGQSQVFVISQKNIDGITIKATQKSATASETINALVLVRRFRLLQTRKIVSPFPVMVRMKETNQESKTKSPS